MFLFLVCSVSLVSLTLVCVCFSFVCEALVWLRLFYSQFIGPPCVIVRVGCVGFDQAVDLTAQRVRSEVGKVDILMNNGMDRVAHADALFVN